MKQSITIESVVDGKFKRITKVDRYASTVGKRFMQCNQKTLLFFRFEYCECGHKLFRSINNKYEIKVQIYINCNAIYFQNIIEMM